MDDTTKMVDEVEAVAPRAATPPTWADDDPFDRASVGADDDRAPLDDDPVSARDRVASASLVVLLAVAAVGGGFALGRQLKGGSVTPGAAEAPSGVGQGPDPIFDDAIGYDFVPEHPLVGQPAPDFALYRLDDGRPASLGDYAGRPLLVNFWATWCPPCRYEMPLLQTAHESHADAGFLVLAVNAGERVAPEMVDDTVGRYVTSMGLTFPVLMGDNGRLQHEYEVWGLPASYLIDRDGTIAYVHTGMYTNQEMLERQLVYILD